MLPHHHLCHHHNWEQKGDNRPYEVQQNLHLVLLHLAAILVTSINCSGKTQEHAKAWPNLGRWGGGVGKLQNTQFRTAVGFIISSPSSNPKLLSLLLRSMVDDISSPMYVYLVVVIQRYRTLPTNKLEIKAIR